jgi:TonB family protein
MFRSRAVRWSLLVLALAVPAATSAQPSASPTNPANITLPPPTDVPGFLAQGQLRLVKGQNGLAVDSFRQAVQRSQGLSFPAWLGLAKALSLVQRDAEAIDSARHAQSLAGTPDEKVEAGQVLGNALLSHNDAADAVPIFKELLAAGGAAQRAARAPLLAALLLTDHDAEAKEALAAFRSAGAGDGDVQVLLCRVGEILVGHQSLHAADRLHALDPEAALAVGEQVTRPLPLTRSLPVYPEEARKERLTGVVILQTVIKPNGRAESFEVLKGMPKGMNESAIESVKKWTFQPATLDGKAVPVCYILTVNFQLQNKS